ncbi:MAG: response regulator transcription factor [Flavobacteriales bacterium]
MTEDIVHVALFDDSKVIRDSLGTLLSTTPGIGLCGCFPNAERVVERVDACKPDVVLMDIDMPGINGIEAVRLLHAQHPELPVIMLTVFADAERVYAALCAGAMGYLLKNTDPNELLEAISEVKQGGAPMTPSIARKVMLHFQRLPNTPEAPMDDPGLSPREMEVLQELVAGLSYKMIAEKLNISFETVRSHIKHVYEKLHVHNNAEAVAKTLKGGFLR